MFSGVIQARRVIIPLHTASQEPVRHQTITGVLQAAISVLLQPGAAIPIKVPAVRQVEVVRQVEAVVLTAVRAVRAGAVALTVAQAVHRVEAAVLTAARVVHRAEVAVLTVVRAVRQAVAVVHRVGAAQVRVAVPQAHRVHQVQGDNLPTGWFLREPALN